MSKETPKRHQYVPTNEQSAALARRDSHGHVRDEKGQPFDITERYVGGPAAYKKAVNYLGSSPADRIMGHQFKSIQQAEQAREDAVKASAEYVAEHLPEYMAIALDHDQRRDQAVQAAKDAGTFQAHVSKP